MQGKGKGKGRYSSSWGEPTSELRDVTCHMGSHSVTCHPTQVNALRLTPAMKADTRFTYPGGMEGWVELPTFRSRVCMTPKHCTINTAGFVRSHLCTRSGERPQKQTECGSRLHHSLTACLRFTVLEFTTETFLCPYQRHRRLWTILKTLVLFFIHSVAYVLYFGDYMNWQLLTSLLAPGQ